MEQPALAPTATTRMNLVRLITAQRIAWLILCIGAIMRVSQYIANRSLWLDESRLALNIINRGFAGLMQPLDYNQAAPIGFLWVEHGLVRVAGNSEYILRLLPLLASMVALYALWQLGKRVLPPAGALAALAIAAFSEPLIVYASEVKQYSSDMAIAIGLTLLALWLLQQPINWQRSALLGLAGGLAVWCSHPALFVFGGIGLVLVFNAIATRRLLDTVRLAIAGIPALAAFGLSYFTSLRATSGNNRLQNYWNDSFMPFPPRSLADARWFGSTFYDIFSTPGGIRGYAIWLAIGLCVFGGVWLFRSQRTTLALLAVPALLALFASALHVYPFDGRLLVFLAPALALLIGAGVAAFGRLLPFSAGVQAALIVLLVAQPFWSASYAVTHPRSREEMRPLLVYIHQHYQPGQALYVYHGAAAAYRYYAPRMRLPNTAVFGIDAYLDQARYEQDLQQLRGHSAWVIFSHVQSPNKVSDEVVIQQFLDHYGVRLDAVTYPGASAYLYEFRS